MKASAATVEQRDPATVSPLAEPMAPAAPEAPKAEMSNSETPAVPAEAPTPPVRAPEQS